MKVMMEIPGKELERLIRAKEGEDKALHDEMIRRLSWSERLSVGADLLEGSEAGRRVRAEVARLAVEQMRINIKRR